METDPDLEKQLMPVRLSSRWMGAMAGSVLLPSLLFLIASPFLRVAPEHWYLWSVAVSACGISVTLFVAIMCFLHFRRVGEITPPVIGLGLLCLGSMDLIQVMVGLAMGGAQGTLSESERNALGMAFSVSRSFYAFALMSAAAFAPLRDRVSSEAGRRHGMSTLYVFTLVFVCASIGILSACFAAQDLLAIVSQNAWLRRITHGLPVVLFLVAGLYVLPTHYAWHGKVFGQVLLISVFPLLLAQLHFLADGGQLGGHYFMAMVLSLVAYLIPFIGLMVDYWKLYARLQEFHAVLRDRLLLVQQTRQVSDRGNDLFLQLMRHTRNPILVLDSSHRVNRISDQLAEDLGLKLGEKALPQLALARPLEKVLGPDVLPVLKPFFERAERERKMVMLDTPLPVKGSDAVRGLKWRVIPVFDGQQRLIAYLLVGNHV
jgi:hypothetical protein